MRKSTRNKGTAQERHAGSVLYLERLLQQQLLLRRKLNWRASRPGRKTPTLLMLLHAHPLLHDQRHLLHLHTPDPVTRAPG